MSKVSQNCSVDGCPKAAKNAGMCWGHYHRRWKHGDPLAGGTSPGSAREFLFNVAVPFTGDGCLIWPFARVDGRYGRIHIGGKTHLAHRLVCETAHGPPPTPEHEAAHSCGQGHDACVNPRHLRWLTPAENTAEKQTHGTQLRGEQIHTHALTEDDVRTIRRLGGHMRQKDIAKRFGVLPSAVSRILSGKRWGWLD